MCPDSFKQFRSPLFQKVSRHSPTQLVRILANRPAPHHPATLRIGHRPQYLKPTRTPSAMHPNRHLATTAQRRQRHPLCRHRKSRVGVIQKSDYLADPPIPCANLNPQRALPRRWANHLRLQPLSNPLRFFEAI
jgi:hypothetical protein